MTLAPLLAIWMESRWGWRTAFIATGMLGLAWIPLWRAVGNAPVPVARTAGFEPYRDRRLWAICGANALHAIPYSLWFAWTTKYFVTVFGLNLADANAYAWIPPGFAAVGGFLCGWASLKVAQRGGDVVTARRKVCLGAAIVALATGLVPLAPSPAWAAAAISLGIGAVAGFSVNLYALPLDIFGESRAAFSISLLVSTYGATTALTSWLMGVTRVHYGYVPITTVAAVTPLIACAVLRGVKATR
jgi:ACS family hexuronate transporter-like MFS transporter